MDRETISRVKLALYFLLNRVAEYEVILIVINFCEILLMMIIKGRNKA